MGLIVFSSSGSGLVITGCTLEETGALFDGHKIPRTIEERGHESPIALTSRSPLPRRAYPEKDALEDYLPGDYLELQERGSVRSRTPRPRSLESQSEESAITFSK